MIAAQYTTLAMFGFSLFATLCGLIDQSEGVDIMAASAGAFAAIYLILESFA